MSVYIQDMEMPKEMRTLTIFPNGYVAVYNSFDTFINETKAIQIPPHGRLIDADELMKTLRITGMDCEKCVWSNHTAFCTRGPYFIDACCAIECAPTIIPADKEEPDGT